MKAILKPESTSLQQQWLTRQMHGNRHHHPFNTEFPFAQDSEFHDLAIAKHKCGHSITTSHRSGQGSSISEVPQETIVHEV
ncbi:hypothetical protein D5086_005320 [Populus alba]|uniref:Uncharacterized protein n=1 Tax=Populus alba TaxID=43335 RepID=A0ACC4CT91_POPAL